MYILRTKKAKQYITCIILLATLIILIGCTAPQNNSNVSNAETREASKEVAVIEISPSNSFELLKEGNARFIDDKAGIKDISLERRQTLTEGQHPFAIVVSCSDSRIPPEIVFDQALGDLFVVRLAGNLVDSVALGSIEYAAAVLESPLIVVMGHEKCGAVIATAKGEEVPGSIDSIVRIIQPSVEKVKAMGVAGDELYEKATDENILNSIEEIEKSPIVKELIGTGNLKILGAKYILETGEVKFFSEVD
ncbi:carbonic anhydrase [Clostridium aceticum]|uniref:carbonic anhydrase n=1 Tax=Clostridium aceticum TaxID=84022 RepID=A0A0D8IAN3_9CLOT|nr:carbonic anhydrase [Clostridium aceticum]AKL96504.1 carbonic anhydrase [Clostridium aceticum]KJF27325.1 hypothetical protein TZ02_08285 [Clostridium aceticum]